MARMAVGPWLQLFHMAAELPGVVAQRTEENEVQGMEFQSDETQVEEVMVEVMVDEVLVVEREEELLVVEKEVEFVVLLVWVKEVVLVGESGQFLVQCLDYLRGDQKHVDQCQTELCQVLMLLKFWLWRRDNLWFRVWLIRSVLINVRQHFVN